MNVQYEGSDGWPLWAQRVARRSLSGPRDLPIVLLHGGGPDHQMFLPLARALAEHDTVVLPDIRGYGRSMCADPARHTWSQYAADVMSLLDHLNVRSAIVGGAGLGSTIALRAAAAYPDRIEALVLISVEEIEDDEEKEAEIAFMDAFAERARNDGIDAAWAPILPHLAPLIGELVREAMPRSDRASIAAAAAIGRDRSFQSVDDLARITTAALIFPGMDERHPRELAESLALIMPNCTPADVGLSEKIRNAEDLAVAFRQAIREFLEKTALSRT